MIVLSLLTFALSLSIEAQQPEIPGPSFEDIMNLRDVGSAVISPDGQTIVYTVSSTDWDENGYDTEIWLVRSGEEPFQLTWTKDGSSTNPEWSPDGTRIAFAAKRGEKRQIHLISPRGGEASTLTEVEEGVGGFEWSPDGRFIAFASSESESDRDKAREETYGAFAVEDHEYRMTHLWIVALPEEPGSAEATRLTEGTDYTVSGFAWSPDSEEIAFGHTPDPLTNSWLNADLSIVNITSGEIRPLVTDDGPQSNPFWSPDGSWILYQTSGPDIGSAYYTNGLFYKVPAAGGTPTHIACDLDEDPSITAWTPSGIYLVGWERTKRRL